MKSLGLLVFHEWGDKVIDRPDNSEELMTASIMSWWRWKAGGTVHYFDQRFAGQSRIFNTVPEFYYPAMRQMMFNKFVADPTNDFPGLDYLLVRWRWHNGRPTDDYIMQRQRGIVTYYAESTDTQIVIWDEDYKFTVDTMPEWLRNINTTNITVHRVRDKDTGKMPTGFPCTSTRHCPISDRFLRALPKSDVKLPYTGFGDSKDPRAVMVYIGNNYDRDGALDRWIREFGCDYPGRIHVYGNWLKYDPVVMQGVIQHSKATKAEIAHIHRRALFVPMIAKDIYFEEGHITPRLFEVLAGGSLPIGFNEFYGHEFYYDNLGYEDPLEFESVWGSLLFGMHDTFDAAETKRQWDEHYDAVLGTVLGNNVFNVEKFLSSAGIMA